MNGQEATGADGLIQGQGEVAGNLLSIVFDLGATHSFISLECVDRLKLLVTVLPFDLLVATPANKILIANNACLRCPVVIEGRTYHANLLCLPLKDLDVILGMDWLSRHHILLDCAQRTVVFPEAGISDFLNKYWVVAALKDESREFFLLANVQERKETDNRGILVVRDFPDVFPDDVPGIPPAREIEFTIDLVPGTVPISMAP